MRGPLVRVSGSGLLGSPRLAELALAALPRDCTIVLAFHRVGDELPPWHRGSTPRNLERLVTTFAAAASVIAPAELAGSPVRGRSLVLTFDDGFDDNAEVAAPLLSKLGFPAGFFLPAACVEEGAAPWPDRAYSQLLAIPEERLERLAARLAPDFPADGRLSKAHAVVHGMKLIVPARRERLLAALPAGRIDPGSPMSWEQARTLVARGFDVGSHGQTHAILTTLDDAQLEFELGSSKALIEERVGQPCDLLAYPDNRVDARVAAAAEAAGYRIAFGGGGGVNVDPLAPLRLQRIDGEDSRTAAVALKLVRGSRRDRRNGGGRSQMPVTWLAPAVPTRTTFLDRELAELRRLGVPVDAVAPAIDSGAVRTFLRRPLASAGWLLRLQRLKAPRDRERGRLGYLALGLKGLSLAHRLERTTGPVHASFADGVGTVAFCAAGLAGARFTFTAHSPYSLWQSSRLLKEQAEAAERVFCIADEIERRLGELAPGSRREVARCLGPPAAPAPRPARAPFALLAVGTPSPLKGFHTAIEGVAAALARGLDVRLTIVGDSPALADLRSLAHRLGIQECVTFVGALANEEVLGRLAGALALLAPSEVQPDGDRDGLPVSILDAAACGVPSIATPVAGIPEFVVDGETGLVVPERNPEAIAVAIERLCRDPAFAARLGGAARERLARDHDPAREVGKLVAVWLRNGVEA